MPDYPDYTKPITITGVTIETLPIDIKAQTIENIAIDIAAITSTANLNIDIKAVSDTMPVSNIGTFVNPDFEEGSRGWWLYGIEICIDSSQQLTGGYSLKTGSLEYAFQMISPCLRGDRVKTLSIAYRCSVSGTMKGLVVVAYGDGTADNTILSPAEADTWYVQDVTFNSAKQIIGITLFNLADIGEYVWFDTLALSLYEVVDAVNVTVNVDITAQTVGNLAIDIAAQTVGNLNVDIKAQTVDLNIKTSGGVNLVIDKLTQTAYVSRRSTLSNNGETALWRSVTGDNRDGKFFPRGCRGFLGIIEVYCRQTVTGDETITVYLSPHPSMGPVASATIDVPAFSDPAWRGATFNRMWNYDSMFIFIVTSSANVGIAYDEASPDRFSSTDAGATWTADPHNRNWFRAVMEGETVGDLPVSGTLNTIEIPSLGAARQMQTLNVPPESGLYDTLQVGAGELLIAIFKVSNDDSRDNLEPRVRVDGVDVMPWHTTFFNWNDILVNQYCPGITIGVWDTTGFNYSIIVTIAFPFKRSIEVGFYNRHAESSLYGYVGYSYKKIT